LLGRPELAGHDTRRERALILGKMVPRTRMADMETALRRGRESASLYRQLGEDGLRAIGLLDLAAAMVDWSAMAQDAATVWAEAGSLLEESLSLAHDLRAIRTEGLALKGFGMLAFLEGRREEGEQLVREFIGGWERAGETAGLIAELQWVGYDLFLHGRFAEGGAVMREAVRLCRQRGDRKGEMQSLFWLAIHLGLDGTYGPALAEGQRLLSLASDAGEPLWAGRGQHVCWIPTFGKGLWAEAHQHAEQAVARYREAGLGYWVGELLGYLGMCKARLGDSGGARHCIAEALQLAAGTFSSAIWALAALSGALFYDGSLELSAELWALLERFPVFARSRFVQGITGQVMAAAQAALPPEVFASAQQRGRARDPMATAREMLEMLEEGKI
jgi:tetratricopeptide (TPR) repeat protein